MSRRHAQQAIDEDEQIARYAYVLGAIPVSIADRAYASAFAQLTSAERLDIVEQLREHVPAPPSEPPSDGPDAFAGLMRSLYAREAFPRIRGAAALASRFIASPPVVAYFTVGVGSVSIDQHPPWVHQLARHETAPVKAGTIQPRGASDARWLA